MRRTRTLLVAVILLAACSSEEPASQPEQSRGAVTAGIEVVLTDVSELVEAVSDGVVAVSQGQFRLQVEDLLQSSVVPAGVGTGIVIDDEGHILTNYHVIAGAEAVEITLRSGEERPASIIGEAPELDLALLEVPDPAGLEPIPIGSSDALDVGDPVVAIGNALGLDETAPTVSVGILSARDRTLRAPDGTVLQDLLQTDAAINPGNSGGPLLNGRGELVGVNTAILGGAQNLGFAIAIDGTRQVIEQFLSGTGGPFLGVQLLDNSPRVAAQLRLGTDQGAIVTAVTPGPGRIAGLQPGDIVVEADGDPIRSAGELVAAIESSRPGGNLELRIVRGVDVFDITVTVGRRPVLVG